MNHKQIEALTKGELLVCPQCNQKAVGVEFGNYDVEMNEIEVYLLCENCYWDDCLVGKPTNIVWEVDK